MGKHQCHAICDFFGSFGFFVQFVLAVLSFSALIVKRNQENPRRPMKVFQYDVAKNGLGACTVHFMNIFIAMQFAGKEDPCPWYFIQILFDTTVIVYANFVVLRWLEKVVHSHFATDVSSGDYGDPPQITRWFHQLGVWLTVVVVCKIGITSVEYVFKNPLAEFGAIILAPLCFNPHLELFIVVVFLPLILNAFQFWIMDSYLMYSNELHAKIPSNGLSTSFIGSNYGSNSMTLH
ncbi:hypothetical protein GUITHDRAFT_155592 [Guillardia theta CCMP2712]|uniref:Uncharacterized protein n=3 Tax=Guillardia theta TaxID=55529 RepID=L1IG08_GUITC|nr:hypothetical protein GUITHDRAFT_155592 [Guillardia theta CCMP2712]EKX35017.1 hypothetical protein GUITHDRAFT_155592 [Guillardia theta CCMP2712]|mmetsp:Transcript_23391/g.76012  ORF Transcript_23391/g.76012 Transcript_23391/m.76012 type:complete len:235 (+) Transcript_23391:161-865(+)|eukprot:XP_005821997.1 hypothetical protein GUITHDRAFT_155592 [Guillardia theta CCMP2712]